MSSKIDGVLWSYAVRTNCRSQIRNTTWAVTDRQSNISQINYLFFMQWNCFKNSLINFENILQNLLFKNHQRNFLKSEFLLLAAVVYELCNSAKFLEEKHVNVDNWLFSCSHAAAVLQTADCDVTDDIMIFIKYLIYKLQIQNHCI